jgi:hypothetical protein
VSSPSSAKASALGLAAMGGLSSQWESLSQREELGAVAAKAKAKMKVAVAAVCFICHLLCQSTGQYFGDIYMLLDLECR